MVYQKERKKLTAHCIQPFHSSVCSLPNIITRGVDPSRPPAELAFHFHVMKVPIAKKPFTSQNTDGA